MGRPRVIDDQRILEAARDVFLEKGAATTEEVARRAKISQASIFKRFGSKEGLFLAAMQAERDRQDWMGFLRRRADEVGLKEALVEIGVKIVTFMRPLLSLMLVSWSQRGEFGVPKEWASSHPGFKAAKEMVAFMDGEMQAGRLRRQNPVLVARTFVGALQSYLLMGLLLKKGLVGAELEPAEFVRGVVEVLWEGIAPQPPRKRGRK